MSQPGTIPRDEFFESLLGDFLDESGQLLDRLNENLLLLDEWVRGLSDDQPHRCDAELLNEMFRSAHSLKGLSAMLGLTDVNHLTHKVENIFDAARKNELPIDGDVVELVFQAVDRLGSLVKALKDPHAPPVECESVLEGISRTLQAAGAERRQSTQADAEGALGQLAPRCAAASVEAATQPLDGADVPPEACKRDPCAAIDHFAGLSDETEAPSKYLPIFIDETDLSLDQLTETLLALEEGGSPEALEKLLVTSHRIKGSAASIGLNRPAKLAHLMEDLLQYLVDSGRPLTPKITDALLMCADALRQYVDGLRRGHPESDQFNQLAHELLDARAEMPEAPRPAAAAPQEPAREPGPPLPADVSDDLRSRVAAVCTDPDSALVGRIVFQSGLALVGLKARLVYEKLSNLGEVCYFQPPADTVDDLETLDGVSFGLTTDKPLGEVRGKLRIAGVERMVIEPLVRRPAGRPAAAAPEPAAPRAAASAGSQSPARKPALEPAPESAPHAPASETAAQARNRPAENANKPTETLRVDIERLDSLMNLAGQLVISKARFAQIGDRLKNALAHRQSTQVLNNACAALKKMGGNGEAQGEPANLAAELESLRSQARRIQNDLDGVRRDVEMLGQVRTSVNDLFETIHQLELVSDGIQQSVMDTRMLPIGPLFARFKRVIRDITRGNGKLINLVINGEKTELDKRMIDELGDPLIHMVRNAADHGIETPEARAAAGKPPCGTVTLDAFHRGNSIVIQVSDDGKGLNVDRIAQKALEKGLVATADLEKMTRSQICQLIWEPGLSTAEKVTEVSGRGMGMDIVRSKVEDLNGVVEVESEQGKGTTLTIKLPLTLAILPSLMVDIDGDVFAMPLESVVEIVRVGRKDLATIHGQWTARVRGGVISAVYLDEILTWAVPRADRNRNHAEETTLVVVGDKGREIGLSVDRVIGEEDIVIKSMAENYRNVSGIAGASILGDGRVSLILDLAALIEMASTRRPAAATCPGPVQKQVRQYC